MVLNRLADELPAGERRVTMIGGVALALGYGSRRTTDDADVMIDPKEDASEVLAAAEKIAPDFGLPSGWMNEKGRPFVVAVPEHERGRVVLTTASVIFEVPSTERLLGMKLARWAGQTDIEDGKVLLLELKKRFSEVEDVWSAVGGHVVLAKQGYAKHNLEVLWETLEEDGEDDEPA